MVVMAISGIANLIHAEPVMEIIHHHLGYPDYFPTILGVAKLLGVIALALPGTRRLKEWAYAGFTFDLLAAFVSHSAMHDGLSKQAMPLFLLLVLAASYAGHFRRTVLLDVGSTGGAE
jgi:hypothetical protein